MNMSSTDTLPKKSMGVVPRATWNACEPKRTFPLSYPIRTILDTDTHSNNCMNFETCCHEVRSTQINDMFQIHNHMDIRYSFLIGGDGDIYEGRGWASQPMLPNRFKNESRRALLIAFIGRYYHYSIIPKIMMEAWRALVEYGIQNNYIVKKYRREQLFVRHDDFVI